MKKFVCRNKTISEENTTTTTATTTTTTTTGPTTTTIPTSEQKNNRKVVKVEDTKSIGRKWLAKETGTKQEKRVVFSSKKKLWIVIPPKFPEQRSCI